MTGPNDDTILFPEYKPEQFVARDEVRRVQGHVANLVAGRPAGARAVAFTGEPGVGKTWLLRHLAEAGLHGDGTQPCTGNTLGDLTAGGVEGVHSLYLGLQTWQGKLEDVIKALIIAMDKQICAWIPLRPTTQLGGEDAGPPADLSRWLEADVRTLLQGKTKALVLLLDHAHEAPWDLLRLLDRHVVGPLTGISRVFVVLAGRGKPFPWEAPDLRGRMEGIEVGPFNKEQTHQQLQRQIVGRSFSEDEVNAIWQLSKGYPRTNYALGRLGRERWREAIGQEIKHMLEPVPEERRTPVRECLEALCVLDRFRDEQIGPMLAGYHQGRARAPLSLHEAETLRRELHQYAFVRWDDDTRPAMWKMHDRLRSLLVAWIRGDRDLWIRLHCAAYRLFSDWTERFPKTRGRWEALAANHKNALAAVSASLTDC